MIINKSAAERGFYYGTVYKSEKVDLIPKNGARVHSSKKSSTEEKYFSNMTVRCSTIPAAKILTLHSWKESYLKKTFPRMVYQK
jgi:hypothetical protein